MASLRIGSGSTPAGSTNWQQYPSGRGVFVDIDTSAAGFTGTPAYFSSLAGNQINGQWKTTGASSIYLPTATKFRIYIRMADDSLFTPAEANARGWFINWMGIQS